MRRLLLVSMLSLIVGCSTDNEPQYFEGVIHVSVDVDARDARLSADLLHWWFGSTLTWTLKDGDYRIDFDNADRESIWYRTDENREYQLRSCDDLITWTTGDAPLGEVLSVTKLDETREIAGYTTYALEVRTLTDGGNESVTRHWYAPDLKVNPDWYTANRTLGWDQIYTQIDSVIIGTEDESEFVAVRRYATSIDVRPVADSTLELPAMDIRESSLEELLSVAPCPMPQ